MKSKKIISLISAIVLTTSLVVASSVSVYAVDQITQTANGTQTATPNKFVEASIKAVTPEEKNIAYGSLDISGKSSTIHDGTVAGKAGKLVMFNSLKDASGNKQLAFTEGATNANAYYTVNSAVSNGGDGQSQGINDWLYFTNSTTAETNAYVPATISGTLAAPAAGETYTGATGTVVGVCKPKVKIFSYNTTDQKWNAPVETDIIIALAIDDGTSKKYLYVGTGGTNLAATEFVKYSEVGDTGVPTLVGSTAIPAFSPGNNYVISKVPSDMAGDKGVTLSFGYNSGWSLEQNSTNMKLATLIDLPESAASGNDLKWDVNMTGNYSSKP